ncbi:hypothetical protein CF319_g9072 [Tilletia indica]|nr:hypothetical protein CF319_g9072 [Tilletia indica]
MRQCAMLRALRRELAAGAVPIPAEELENTVMARKEGLRGGKWCGPLLRLHGEWLLRLAHRYRPESATLTPLLSLTPPPPLPPDITGFEVCIGTPIEALHTWLLGPVKYLFASLARQVKKNTQHFQEVATRLSDANLGGTGLSSKLDGVYLLNNAGGLTGKDMRALAQVVWLAILPVKEAGLLPQSTWDAWRWAGVVTRLMLIEELPRDALDEYKASAE